MQNWAISEALEYASAQLKSASENSRAEARTLLAHILDRPQSWLIAWPEKILTDDEMARFSEVTTRRERLEPLAYLTGKKEFWSLPLTVTHDTLIPRADTECLVETALSLANKHPVQSILDLGTGTGAIALALATERPDLHITATDESSAALAVARQNMLDNKVTNITFVQSDWFRNLYSLQVSLIVSNPPYIREDDHHLQDLGLQYEPLNALVSGVDGLDDIRTIIEHSPQHLIPNGHVVLEHGFDQGEAVRELFRNLGYSDIQTVQDYAGNDRVTSAAFNSPKTQESQ